MKTFKSTAIAFLIFVGVFAGYISVADHFRTKALEEQQAQAKPTEQKLVLKHLVEIQNCFEITEWVVFIFNDRTNIYYYPTLLPTLKQFVDANSENTVKLRPDRGNCA